MMMACRDIANMHLFFEMKTMFPELSEDIIRQSIQEWPDDRTKCLQSLYREKEKHLLPWQYSSESGHKKLQDTSETKTDHIHLKKKTVNSYSKDFSHMTLPSCYYKETPRNKTVSGNFQLSEKVIFVNSALHYPFRSHVSVDESTSKPSSLSVTYKNHVFHNRVSHLLNQKAYSTKTAPVSSSAFNSTLAYSSTTHPSSKRHKVMLSFTPNLPYGQKSVVQEPSGYVPASHNSKKGRHITSIHLELQPDVPHKRTVKISTALNESAVQDSRRKYDSSIHISFTSHGTSFSAQRMKFPGAQTLSPEVKSKMRSVHQPPTLESCNGSLSRDSAEHKKTEVPKQYCVQSCHRVTSYHHDALPSVPKMAHSKPVANVSRGSLKQDCAELYSFSINDKNSLHQEEVKYYGTDVNAISAVRQAAAEKENMSRKCNQPYIQSVIHHQKLRLEMLRKEFWKENTVYLQTKEQVRALEQELLQVKKCASFLSAFELTKLKEENEKLREQCSLLEEKLKSFHVTAGPFA